MDWDAKSPSGGMGGRVNGAGGRGDGAGNLPVAVAVPVALATGADGNGGVGSDEEAKAVLTKRLTELMDDKRRIKAQLKEYDMNFFERNGRLVRAGAGERSRGRRGALVGRLGAGVAAG